MDSGTPVVLIVLAFAVIVSFCFLLFWCSQGKMRRRSRRSSRARGSVAADGRFSRAPDPELCQNPGGGSRRSSRSRPPNPPIRTERLLGTGTDSRASRELNPYGLSALGFPSQGIVGGGLNRGMILSVPSQGRELVPPSPVNYSVWVPQEHQRLFRLSIPVLPLVHGSRSSLGGVGPRRDPSEPPPSYEEAIRSRPQNIS